MGASLIAGQQLRLTWIRCKNLKALGVAVKGVAHHTPPPKTSEDPRASSNHVFTVTSKVEWAFQLMQVLALCCVKLTLCGLVLSHYSSTLI